MVRQSLFVRGSTARRTELHFREIRSQIDRKLLTDKTLLAWNFSLFWVTARFALHNFAACCCERLPKYLPPPFCKG